MIVEFYHVDAFEIANYESIWRALIAAGVDARIVAVPGDLNRAEKNWFDHEKFVHYCVERGIPFSNKVDPEADIGITTQNADVLLDYNFRVRLMYGPVIYPKAWALQRHSVQPFDAVLTHGQAYTDQFSAWLTKEKLPIIGYPRYDDFFSGELNKKNIRERWGIYDAKPILVFLPTWGENTGFELFFSSLLLLTKDFHVFIRPHHCTLRFEPTRLLLMQSSGMTILDHAFDLPDVYKAADVVLTDVRSGGLFEACMCGVPAVGMVPDAASDMPWLLKNGIDNMASLCDHPRDLLRAVEQSLTSQSQKNHQQQWAESHVSFRDGHASKKAAEILLQLAPRKNYTPTTKKKVLFLLGSAAMSGGTYVILQHALYMHQHGYDVTVALVFMDKDAFTQLKQSSTCWHSAIKALHFIQAREAYALEYDVAIFTWWATLFRLNQVKAKHYVYFVQSIESKFYHPSMEYLRELADRTYQLGLNIITEATWIKNHLEKTYQVSPFLVKNGILKNVYTDKGDRLSDLSPNSLRILVEGPLEAPYKNVARTIQLCRDAMVGEVWLLTSSAVSQYPGVERVFSQVPIESVPAIYRSCDVLVKLSSVEGMFGPPLEMFHCGGTAIVYDVTGYDEYIQHEDNALVVKMGDELQVIQYLKMLNQDRKLLQKLKMGALQTAASWCDWEFSSSQFSLAIDEISATIQPTQNERIMQNYMRYLNEHVPLAVWDPESKNILAKATPLYDTGCYILSMPLAKTIKKLSIRVGEVYRSLLVRSMQIVSIKKGTSAVEPIDARRVIQVELENILQNNQSILDCCSDSRLTIYINHESLTHETHHYVFQIDFSPLSLVQSSAILI